MTRHQDPGGGRSLHLGSERAETVAGQVVVVDDQAANVDLLARLLRSAGIADGHGLTDPHQAVGRCLEVGADLLILDLHMPGKGGLEVMAELREALPERTFLPVIVLTADLTTQTRRRALAAGAHDFLNQPLDDVEVELRVRNVLRTRRLHVSLQQERDELEQRVAERTRELERANEELRAVDQVKSDFVAMVSHEMRTPLTTIHAFPKLMARLWDHLDQSQRDEHIKALERNTGRLGRLIDNLLQAAALEAGVPTLTAGVASHVQLRSLLDEAVHDSDLEPSAVTVDCDPDLHGEVAPGLLESVVANLLTNAHKYGGPPVHISASMAGGELEISVRDHGPGVPPAFAGRLFDRFTQVSVGDRRTGVPPLKRTP